MPKARQSSPLRASRTPYTRGQRQTQSPSCNITRTASPAKRPNTPTRTVKWNDMFGQLQDFFQMHGHCHVPLAYDETLANWTSMHRYYYRNAKTRLSSERKQQLDALDPEWHCTKNARRLPVGEFFRSLSKNVEAKQTSGSDNFSAVVLAAANTATIAATPAVVAVNPSTGVKPKERSRCTIS
jgi:hypothetical protein